MEKRLSYILVGSFVVVLTLALFSFLYWLEKYGNERVEHDYYYTYFIESVSGLSVESPIKYRGVDVGRVRKIAINKKNSEEVEVLLEIKKGTPIKEDTYATLGTQGITGLKYIELKGGSKNSALVNNKDGKIETIKSKKSTISTLFDNGEIISTRLNSILKKVELVLNDKNIDNFSATLANLSSATGYIDKNKHKIIEMFDKISKLKLGIQKDLDIITQSIKGFSSKGRDFLEHTKKFEDVLIPSFKKLGDMGERAGDASDSTKIFFDNMQKELANGEFSFADIVAKNMQILNETVMRLKILLIQLNETVLELKNSPSDILYKSTQKIPGPGEGDE